jgi:uncharacterized membrane protein YraQ (UPF0718 family)
MEWRKEIKILAWIIGAFLVIYFLPIGKERFDNAVLESLQLLKWYAREHVLLCLVPAFFIAGVISVFISQDSVIKYLGPTAKPWKSYLVASVSGSILAVCSCTVLPLFASIHKRGAGLGPATTFLYAGPGINILAIILTARILGYDLGLARVIAAILFSIVIGLLMAFFFGKEERERGAQTMNSHETSQTRPMWQSAFHFFVLVFILIFANWGRPETEQGFLFWLWNSKWQLTAFFGLALAYSMIRILKVKLFHVTFSVVAVAITAFIFPGEPLIPFLTGTVALVILTLTTPGEPQEWLNETWWFTKQILPLLAGGVLIAGLLLGAPGGQGLIPNEWVESLVGGNSLGANLVASVLGAFMYFATLTEIPIVEGLLNSGMGKGPALALLLAGPAISLPNMLVIRSVIGTKKTLIFISLVVVMATTSGLLFGLLF